MAYEILTAAKATPGGIGDSYSAPMYYVYLLESHPNPGHHYVGYTAELKTRFAHQISGKNSSTASHRRWNLADHGAIPDEKGPRLRAVPDLRFGPNVRQAAISVNPPI